MNYAASLAILPLLFAARTLPAQAQGLELPVIFSDHMVMQRGKPVLVWGRDKPGTELVIQFGKQQKKSKARLDGSWSATLNPVQPGPARELRVRGSSEVLIRDILVGEVWFCSGQSNMEWALQRSAKGKEAITAAQKDGIRLFKTDRVSSKAARFDVKGGPWTKASPKTARSFSAVAWYFGLELHKKLGVPIGLVQCTWGGTRIQSWMSPEQLADKSFRDLTRQWSTQDKRAAVAQKAHDKWKVKAEKAKRNGKQPPKEPRKVNTANARHRPAGLFLGMAGPLLPYAYAGVIWYQGEANLKEASSYASFKRMLVQDWRRVSQQELPFYWVQLASFKYRNSTERQLALLWEAQDQARDLPRTGMASAVDIGNPKNIHPTNKTEVGRRLSLLALAEVYGQEVESRGPELTSWKKQGKEIRLNFSHCDGGLISKAPLQSFEVAGSNRKFFAAAARIDGSSILLTCQEVPSVKAIRYAFKALGPFPVYNQTGLPLTPFRTDNWLIKGQ
jgi:sialate O-acetylesterase